MGAGKWKSSYYSDTLKGADVYIISDNDDIGKNHVQKVAEFLLGKAKSIHTIDLTSAMPDLLGGGDMSDLIALSSQDEIQSTIEELKTSVIPFIAKERGF